MLAFLKRWRKAYLEDKSNRLHAEAKLDMLRSNDNIAKISAAFSKLSKQDKRTVKAYSGTEEECMEKGYYY